MENQESRKYVLIFIASLRCSRMSQVMLGQPEVTNPLMHL